MAESFFTRWARLKSENAPEESAAPADPRVEAAADEAPPAAPSMEEARMLQPDSDFSRYVARSADPDVRRSALKTLFSDPHFQRMDGLDIYIDDYTKPSPLSPEMVAALWHARSTLNPRPLYPVPEEPATESVTAAEAQVQAQEDGHPAEPDEAAIQAEPSEPEEESSSEGTHLPFNEHVNFSHGSDQECQPPKSV